MSLTARQFLQRLAEANLYTIGEVALVPERELKQLVGRPGTLMLQAGLTQKSIRLRYQDESKLAFFRICGVTPSRDDFNAAWLREPIEALEIGNRTYNCLKSVDLQTIGYVTFNTGSELLGIPHFGRKSLGDLRSSIEQIGLKLRGD